MIKISEKIELVQEYLTVEGVTLKEKLEKKHSAFEHGWTLEDGLVVFYHSPTRRLADNPLRSPRKYKWGVNGEKIIAINGSAIEITPELDYRN